MKIPTYTIRTDKKRRTSQIISAGHYGKVNPWVNEKNFPMKNLVNGERKISVLKPETEQTTSEILTLGKRSRLVRPVTDDALLFGEQFPNEQLQGGIVFLHEPWYMSGHSFYLLLDLQKGVRELQLVSAGERWPARFRFGLLSL